MASTGHSRNRLSILAGAAIVLATPLVATVGITAVARSASATGANTLTADINVVGTNPGSFVMETGSCSTDEPGENSVARGALQLNDAALEPRSLTMPAGATCDYAMSDAFSNADTSVAGITTMSCTATGDAVCQDTDVTGGATVLFGTSGTATFTATVTFPERPNTFTGEVVIVNPGPTPGTMFRTFGCDSTGKDSDEVPVEAGSTIVPGVIEDQCTFDAVDGNLNPPGTTFALSCEATGDAVCSGNKVVNFGEAGTGKVTLTVTFPPEPNTLHQVIDIVGTPPEDAQVIWDPPVGCSGDQLPVFGPITLEDSTSDRSLSAGRQCRLSLKGTNVPTDTTIVISCAATGDAACLTNREVQFGEDGTATLKAVITFPGPAGPHDKPEPTPTTGTAALSKASAVPGDSLQVTGGGFAPNASLAIELHSDPLSVGTTSADSAGNFSATITLPASTPSGTHTIVVTGRGANGAPRTVTAGVAVTAAPVRQPATEVRTEMPQTGTGSVRLLATGVLLILSGWMALAGLRMQEG